MNDDLNLDMFPDFSFDDHAAAETIAVADAKVAVDVRTRARIHARRAKAEAHLADILPADIADGDAWHILSSGDIDSLSYLAHMLAHTRMDYVALSTWCMAREDVARLAGWLADGTIGRLDAYVGEIFPNQYADEYEALCAAVATKAGRVCVFRNHSKVYLCRAGHRAWVIESSANINTNPRTENTIITADHGLYAHHVAYYSGARSFDRRFDAWSPPDE